MEDIIWKTLYVRNIMEDKTWKVQIMAEEDFMFHSSHFLAGQHSQDGLEKDIVKLLFTIYYLFIYYYYLQFLIVLSQRLANFTRMKHFAT